MKKVILGVLALIFTIALVIAGYMMFASPNLQKHTVTDAPCPFSWKELRDGTVRLEINTLAYPDYNWDVECYPKNVVAVTREESTTETVVFSILPLNAGQSVLGVAVCLSGELRLPSLKSYTLSGEVASAPMEAAPRLTVCPPACDSGRARWRQQLWISSVAALFLAPLVSVAALRVSDLPCGSGDV